MATLSILTTSLPRAFVGVAYQSRLQAGGGVGPYTWSASGLPSGMFLNAVNGKLTAASGALKTADVGTRSVSATIIDANGSAASVSLSLELNPSSRRRTAELVLDPRLETLLALVDTGVLDRETLTSHFSSTPTVTQINTNGVYIGDSFVHTAAQILYSDASSPGTSPVPSPISVYDKVESLSISQQYLAEPVILTVTGFTKTETTGETEDVVGFLHDSGYLGDNSFVNITEHTDAPLYTASPDGDSGYFAVAQKFQIPASADVQTVKIYASRPTSDQTGNLVVGVSVGASPANVHMAAGATAIAYGDGSNVIASKLVNVSSVDVVAARTSWDSPQLLTIVLSPSPAVSPATSFHLTGDTDYYLTISSDYVLDSPLAGYVQVAVSIDTNVGNEVPGSGGALTGHSIGLGTDTSTSSPTYSPAQFQLDLIERYESYNSPSPVDVESIAFQIDAIWSDATRGVAIIGEADPFNSPSNDRYWVGDGDAAETRNTALRLIDGYSTRGASPVEDLTNFNELVDSIGNPVIFTELRTTNNVAINPAGGGQTDSDDFLVTEGIIIRVKNSPNPEGSLPPVPFKILGGARRKITDLSSASLIRTANKTGSTDSEVLAAILSTLPTNPVLSIGQIPPDAAGDIDILAGDSTIVATKNFSNSSIELTLGASINAKPTGGSPVNVIWSSAGIMTMVGGQNVTITPSSNQLSFSAEPGVTTLASISPDGSGNIVLAAVADSSHATQTFVTISTGANTVNIGSNIPDASTSLAGLMTTSDKDRIDALFSGTYGVTVTGTGSVAGGHAHRGTALQVGRSLAGYSTIGSTTTIADALEIINQVLSGQFGSASESANLTTITTDFSPFYAGYIADASPSPGTFSYGASPYLPGLLNTRLTQVADTIIFRTTTTAFGNPGQADTVSVYLGDNTGFTSPALEILDLAGSYSNAISLFGSSPSSSGDYTTVAALMEANPLKPTSSPSAKLDFIEVDFLGFKSPSNTPVFELVVKAEPTIGDWTNSLGYLQIQMDHDTGATTRVTNVIDFFHDTPLAGESPKLSASPSVVISSSRTPRHVSGIPHYPANTPIGLVITAQNLFNATYVQQPVLIRDTDADQDIQVQYYAADEASPHSTAWIPNIHDTFTVGSPSSPHELIELTGYLVNQTNNRTSRPFTVVVADPYAQYSPDAGLIYADPNASPHGRVLHLGRSGLVASSATSEYLFSEKYRIDPEDWGGTDFDSPSDSPTGTFVQFTVQPSGDGTTSSDTYGWPNETPLLSKSLESTWNVTSSPGDAAGRSGKDFSVSPYVEPGILQSMPAMVSDMGIVHPGYNAFYNFDAKNYMPSGGLSPINAYGAQGASPDYAYFGTYASVDSVAYYRLFTSGTAANQGRLRIYGYKRTTSADTVSAYESNSGQLDSPDLQGSYYNYGPAQVSPGVPMVGITAEIKFVGDESGANFLTPRSNPGLTGWLDLLTTPGASLYESGEDGYGALDTVSPITGIDVGSGYVDIYWRAGSFSTGLTNNQAVVRIGIHEPEYVITKIEMFNQASDTAWSNGA
jgi:hypothetical protein